VIAGTHGKTTATCLATVLLKANGASPGWLVGGVPRDLPDSAALGKSGSPFVIEGDEYDSAFFDKRSKFIQYLPQVLVINNIEFDHADIFRDLEDVLRTFSHGLRVVPGNGVVVANGDDQNVEGLVRVVTWCPVVRVGVGANNDAVIADFKETANGSTFTLLWKGREWAKIKWALPGLFNARNAAVAAVSAGLLLNSADPTVLKLDALAGFQGVMRRQQVLVNRSDLVVIEDFGHHPTALACTLDSLRTRYPEHELVACFEPRSNTAARKLMQTEFQEALAKADAIYLVPAHRAEKLGAESFDSLAVVTALKAMGRSALVAPTAQDLLSELRASSGKTKRARCVVFFSNGSFGGIISQFAQNA
jgi:UDP-N-acetylmuramate: L-alanyl-gamma-D-glutamyl-meso-diaminopimelate ligase